MDDMTPQLYGLSSGSCQPVRYHTYWLCVPKGRRPNFRPRSIRALSMLSVRVRACPFPFAWQRIVGDCPCLS